MRKVITHFIQKCNLRTQYKGPTTYYFSENIQINAT